MQRPPFLHLPRPRPGTAAAPRLPILRATRRILAVALGPLLVVGAVTGAGVAFQAYAAATGTFSACLTSGGALVNVTLSPQPPSTCPTLQTSVSWNQAGPSGPSGPS